MADENRFVPKRYFTPSPPFLSLLSSLPSPMNELTYLERVKNQASFREESKSNAYFSLKFIPSLTQIQSEFDRRGSLWNIFRPWLGRKRPISKCNGGRININIRLVRLFSTVCSSIFVLTHGTPGAPAVYQVLPVISLRF